MVIAYSHIIAFNRPLAPRIRDTMPFGFYIIMAAQFFSSLADNALLVAAIALLMQMQSPEWMTPLLKFFFTISYVLLAAFVGAFADSMPKWRVMFMTNSIKVIGCALLFFHELWQIPGVPPYIAVLLSYAVVGIGAAAYSPAKYGILTEYLPHHKLVIANGWIEGLTVSSIILGTLLGGLLISQSVSSNLLAIDIPHINTGVDTPAEAAITIIMLFYALAAAFNLYIPNTHVEHPPSSTNPWQLIKDFIDCNNRLWTDKFGQISLATTTLFWGAGATLQFIVLKWAEVSLGYTLSQASLLQGVCAVGIAVGAVIAAKVVPLHRAVEVIPVGIAMGLVVIVLNFATSLIVAIPLLLFIGGLAGFFVVPMNALLQHRGHLLMGAGNSIAVQNFNENLSILAMIGLYSTLIWLDLSIHIVVVMFGLFVTLSMTLVRKTYLKSKALGALPDIPQDAAH
jgi:MFS family permease